MVDPIRLIREIEEKEEPYDTGNPEEVNKARKKAARTKADRLKFISAAMQHEEGRAWFYDILRFCRVFEGPYPEDPYKAYFQLGARNVGLSILGDIQEAAPKEYLTMIQENKVR